MRGWWFMIAWVMVLGGCNDRDVVRPPEAAVCDVVISPASATLPVGGSAEFTLLPACPVLSGALHWETADTTVALVAAAAGSRVTVTARKPGTTSVIGWPLAAPAARGAALVQVLPTGAACTAELRNNITVLVRDSVSGAAAATGASGTVSSGSYQNTLVPFDTLRMFEGPKLQEHAGVYTVRVSKPGYRDWARSDVVVSADECHVHTVVLTVLLVPGG